MSRALMIQLVAALAAAAAPLSAQIVFEPPRDAPVVNFGKTQIGDLNGDGVPDAVVGTSAVFQFEAAFFTALIGQANGTFIPMAPALASNANGTGIALTDWNGDGFLDVLHTGAAQVFTRLGNGDGTFSGFNSFPAGNFIADHPVAFDADGDTRPDLVVINPPVFPSSTFGGITIVTRPGGVMTTQSISFDTKPTYAHPADMNNDGLIDIVTVNTQSGTVSWFENFGGTFSNDRTSDIGGRPAQIAIADFDEDGVLDVAAVDADTDLVRVHLGLGNGFVATEGIDANVGGVGVSQISAGDFDDDGTVDLAILATTTDDVTVLRGNGDGTFAISDIVSLAGNAITLNIGPLAVADLDLDGRDDIAFYTAGDASLTTLLNYTYAPDAPFLDLGESLAGTNGHPVHLASGTLLPGEPYGFELRGGLPNSNASYVVGFSEVGVPFKGGTMVPSVDVLITPLPMDALGDIVITGNWPTDVPSGFEFWLQFWFKDSGGIFNEAGSNALRVTVP